MDINGYTIHGYLLILLHNLLHINGYTYIYINGYINGEYSSLTSKLLGLQFTQERLCIITGGTSRLGSAIARGLAASGRFQRTCLVPMAYQDHRQMW